MMAAPPSDLPPEGIALPPATPLIKNAITWDMFKKVVDISKINPLLRPRLPTIDEPACEPFTSCEVAEYVKQITVGGLRLPLSPPAQELCRFYGMSPGQLTPVGWLVWSCYAMLCGQAGIPYNLDLFRYHYRITHAVGGHNNAGFGKDAGFYTVKHRAKVGSPFIIKLPNFVRSWKCAWFFVSDPGDFPRGWLRGSIDDSKPPSSLSDDQLKSFSSVLRRRGATPYKNIFKSNEDLYPAGLFPQFHAPFEPNWANYSVDQRFSEARLTDVEGVAVLKRKRGSKGVTAPPKKKRVTQDDAPAITSPEQSTSEAHTVASEQDDEVSSPHGHARLTSWVEGQLTMGDVDAGGGQETGEGSSRRGNELVVADEAGVAGEPSEQTAAVDPGVGGVHGDDGDVPDSMAGREEGDDDGSSARWAIGDHITFAMNQMKTVRWVAQQLYTLGAQASCQEKGVRNCMEKLRATCLQAVNMATYAIEECGGWDEKENMNHLLSLKLETAEEELAQARRHASDVEKWCQGWETSPFSAGWSMEELQASFEKDVSPLFRYPNIKHKFDMYKRRVQGLSDEVHALSQKVVDASVDAVARFKTRPSYLDELREAKEEGMRECKESSSYQGDVKKASEVIVHTELWKMAVKLVNAGVGEDLVASLHPTFKDLRQILTERRAALAKSRAASSIPGAGPPAPTTR